MTMRLDVVTNDAGELVRRERSRELGANVVVDLYRLVKLVQMHELSNAAVQRQREQTYETIQEYCLRSGGGVNILFADKAIFVGGQLLKGSRAVYENAVELAEILQRLGGSEVTIARELTPDDVMQLSEALANALRGIAGSFRSPTPRFRLRPVSDAARLRGLELEQLAEEQRIVRTYASAIVILRRFFESLENSHYVLPRRIKRVAQTLVDLSAGATPAFLGVTEVRNANDDAAGRAVNTAILSVSTVRQLTEQRSVLVQVAMAAMLFDVARPRALALAGSEGSPAIELSEDQEDRLAAGTAAVLAALGRVNEPSVTRTVVAFEAHWLRRQQWLGAMYNGVRVPTLHARVVRIARRYNDILTPEPGSDPPSPHHAVAVLYDELEDPKDRTALRLLVAALRIMPVGTVVRLSSGEVGEVVKGGDPEYPLVRVAMDAHGAVLASPKEVDLSREMRVRIDSVISTEGWRKGREEHGNEAAYDDDPDSDPGQSAPPPAMHQPPAHHQHRAPSYRPPSVPAESERRYTTAPPVADQDAQSGHSYQSGVDPQSYPSSESFPSVGTSPSQVAEAFGNLLSESKLRKHNSVSDELRTMMVPSDAALKFRARTREPSASGNLATTPLAHVLVYMLDHTLGGSILFTEPLGREHMLFFEGGVPAQARLGMQTPRIGDILMRLGLIDPATMERAAQEANRLGVLVGEYLVGERKLRRADLLRALEAQLTERVAALANLDPGTEYAFFPDVNLLAEQAQPHAESILTSALNVILAVVRAWEDRSRIAATLTRVAKHTLLLHTEADVEAFALTSDEESVLTEIQAGAPKLAALIDEGIADARTIETLVYAFSITRQFAFKGQKKGPMAPKGFRSTRTAPPLPPGPSSGGFPSVTQSVGALRVAADVRENPGPASPRVFAPEVPASASSGSSHAGPPSSSSMPSSGPVSRRPMVPSVRPKIRLRSDGPTSLRAPFSAPSMPPSLPASHLAPRANDTQVDTQPLDDDDEVAVERAIEAMTEQRLAEAALQRNDYETALHHANKAAQTDPSQVEYQLLRAYIQGLIDPMTLEDGIAVATGALDVNAENESALLYRARMHKLAGMHKDALSDYRTLYGLSPGHPEAEAEIRVLRQQR